VAFFVLSLFLSLFSFYFQLDSTAVAVISFLFFFKFEDFFSLALFFPRYFLHSRCTDGGGLLVVVGVHQLGENLAGMARGVEVVGVLGGLLLGALFAAVAGENVLVMVEVVVLVLIIKVRLGHSGDLELRN